MHVAMRVMYLYYYFLDVLIYHSTVVLKQKVISFSFSSVFGKLLENRYNCNRKMYLPINTSDGTYYDLLRNSRVGVPLL